MSSKKAKKKVKAKAPKKPTLVQEIAALKDKDDALEFRLTALEQGVGIAGEKGEKGDPGKQGEQGAQGKQGKTGGLISFGG